MLGRPIYRFVYVDVSSNTIIHYVWYTSYNDAAS